MGWFGKLTFGSLGLFLTGNPLGAIAGAALGHHLFDRKFDYADGGQKARIGQGPSLGRREQVQATYFVSIFSILGKLSCRFSRNLLHGLDRHLPKDFIGQLLEFFRVVDGIVFGLSL